MCGIKYYEPRTPSTKVVRKFRLTGYPFLEHAKVHISLHHRKQRTVGGLFPTTKPELKK